MSVSAMAVPQPAQCAHCGLRVAPHLVRQEDSRQFCCTGCRQVHALIREWGFERYYELPEARTGAAEPARVTGRSFDDFDDAAMQAAATEAAGAERLKTRLYLEGVHCSACVWLVEKLPEVLPGVNEIRLNVSTAVAEVTWQPGRIRLSRVARTLDALGYTPHVQHGSRVQDARRAADRATLARLGVAVACAMNLMFVSGALYAGGFSGMAGPYQSLFRWFSLVIAVPVVAYSARPFFQTAIGGLRVGAVHIDLPIALGIAAGFAASAINVFRGEGELWFDSLAMLIAALLGARQLQRAAQRVAIERADSLRGVAFLEFARKIDVATGAASEVPLSALLPGDSVEVRSGELVPVDGTVVMGRSSLDNAVLTGETTPASIIEGDLVNAGATNLGARIVVSVNATGAQTRVGTLLTIVEEALSRKPALMAITDTLSQRFVVVLLALAAATAVVVGTAQGTEAAMARVIALLVVSCPCALGLSVPLSISMALMRAARSGIFVKNPDALERLRRVGIVLLDKTGTLTGGQPSVVRWHGDLAVLELARTLEMQSSHAIAGAFHRFGGSALHLVRHVQQVHETGGRGISGRVDGRSVRIGTRAYVSEAAYVPAGMSRVADAMLADGLSPVFVAVDRDVAGVAAIGDALRPDALRAVAMLQAQGMDVRILSGDHPEVVARIGRELQLPAGVVHGGMTPEDKREYVSALMSAPERDGAVVMVGDGVNDAAALALADVGVAVQGGRGAAIVAADVVFTREGVMPVLQLIDGARRLGRVVRRNIGFSLVYNAVVSVLAIAGTIGPLAAAVLMPMSSLTVAVSSTVTRTFALRGQR